MQVEQGVVVVWGTPSSVHCSPKVSKGEETETGHIGGKVTNKDPPPGAVVGTRLVKDVLQLLHPQMMRVQGKW